MSRARIGEVQIQQVIFASASKVETDQGDSVNLKPPGTHASLHIHIYSTYTYIQKELQEIVIHIVFSYFFLAASFRK